MPEEEASCHAGEAGRPPAAYLRSREKGGPRPSGPVTLFNFFAAALALPLAAPFDY